MATLGTQTISTSYTQLLKTFGSNIVDGTLRAISSGDEAGVSALQISTTGVKSTGSLAVDGLATVGTLEIGATGPNITKVSYGTFPFTGGTVQTHAANDTTTGTFALPCQLGDIVFASINSLGSTTGTALVSTDFFPIATDVVRFNIIGKGSTAGTIPAGTIFATAMRFTT
jgi:hypothetical protein